jgi:hypothetical protein
MPRRRVLLDRKIDEIVNSIRKGLDDLDAEPAADAAELRLRVRLLIEMTYDVRELALHHLSKLISGTSASTRILAYLKLFVGESVDGEELDIVSGISEYPRRIREWRVDHGWPIRTDGTRYILERSDDPAKKRRPAD